ncbi:helix-hairpin-helix domain-containing protein [Streptomyces sp. NPDC060194]|uniref:helix-hairpin-helix domain-containing protein n=1 Tax=Streptomyces sp. NPDC060194 TaxID=3347069 RepID=UPI003655CAFC
MSSGTDDPATRLADRRWRLQHSAWLLAVILGFGFLSFVGFVYVGLRVRSRRFWIAMTVACVTSALCWVVTASSESSESGEQASGAGAGVTLAVWVAQIAFGVIINREYLRWRSGQSGANAWYNQVNADATDRPAHRPSGVSGALAPAPLAAPSRPALPSVNSADRTALVSVLGADDLADRIVAARQVHGAFHDLDQLAAAAHLRPHEMVAVRGRVSFNTAAPAEDHSIQAPRAEAEPRDGEKRNNGRILDF